MKIANIAELKTRKGTDGFNATVLGYYTAADSGGGEFYWDNVSTATDNGGTIIQVTSVTTGRWLRVIKSDISPKMFGAKGDGVTNDTDAFQSLSNYVNSVLGINIIIPKGNYLVFKQNINPSPTITSRYYQSTGNILSFTNCNNFTINFENANLITASGLRYGSFDPLTGLVYNAPPGGFTNTYYVAEIGNALAFSNCNNVIVNNFKADGQNTTFINGGYWGDVDRQLLHYGIHMKDSKNIIVNNAKITSFGQDGLYITATTDNFISNISINDTESTLNGRQGLSITGGEKISINRCSFTKTGKGGVRSSPSAGADIESNGKTIRNVNFDNCTFSDNYANGLLIVNKPYTSQIFVRNSVIHGSTAAALWDVVGASYFNTVILGGIDNAQYSEFDKCTFSDNNVSYGYSTVFTAKIFRNGNSSTIIKNSIFELYQSSVSELYITSDLSISDSKYYVRLLNPSLQLRVGVIRPILANNFDIIAEYRFTAGNTGVNGVSDHTYIDVAGTNTATNWAGTSKLIGGTDLAWASRTGVTSLNIATSSTNGNITDFLNINNGYKIYSKTFNTTDTANFIDILQVPLASSCKITIAGADPSTGVYGMHLSDHFSISDGSACYHAASSIIFNTTGKGAIIQWKSAVATNADARILQIKTESTASNSFLIKVEVLGINSSATVVWI